MRPSMGTALSDHKTKVTANAKLAVRSCDQVTANERTSSLIGRDFAEMIWGKNTPDIWIILERVSNVGVTSQIHVLYLIHGTLP